MPVRLRVDLVLTALGWVGLVIFLSITVVPGLDGTQSFLGTDLLLQFAPWKTGSEAVPSVNPGLGDTLDQYASWSHLIVSQTQSGSFPQWDPYNAGGGELGSLPNTAIFSPLSLPYWILPAIAAPAAVKILEVIAIALGLWLLLRKQFGLPHFVVPFATLIYATTGFMIAWTNWPQTRVAAFIPLLFWATDRLATGGKWIDIVPMSLVLASMLLGGFPAVTLSAVYAAIVYFVVRVIAARQSMREGALALLRAGTGAVLGALLACVQILPFIWFSTHYIDFEARGNFASSKFDLGVFTTLSTSIVPDMFGIPSDSLAPSTWPGHWIEGFSYLGGAAIILMAAALLVRPAKPFPRGILFYFAGLTLILTVAIYLGTPLRLLIQSLPGISISPFGRMRSLLGFSQTVLAAFGMAALFDSAPLSAQLRSLKSATPRILAGSTTRLVMAGAVLLLPALATLEAYRSLHDSPLLPQSRFWILFAAMVVLLAATAATFVWIKPALASSALAVTMMLGLTLIPAINVAPKWWPLSDKETFFPVTETHRYLDEFLGEERYASIEQTMLPGTSAFYQQRAATGHAFTAPAWKELLSAVEPDAFITPTYSRLSAGSINETINNPILDRMAIKYAIGNPSLDVDVDNDNIAVINNGEATLVERKSVLPRVRWAETAIAEPNKAKRLQILAGTELPATTMVVDNADQAGSYPNSRAELKVADEKETTNEISVQVESTGPGWVVVADPLSNGGWRATVDGAETELINADHAMVAVKIPSAGSHEVILTYQAPLFEAGIVVSSITALGILSGTCVYFALRRRGRGRDHNPIHRAPIG